MHPFNPLQVTRRQFLGKASLGIGSAALASLLNPRLLAASSPGGSPLPHFAPKAKRVIWLTQAGAPSQLETFDYKPGLAAMFDKDMPASVRNGQRLTGMSSGQARLPIAPSVYKFSQHGQSGMWLSEPPGMTTARRRAMLDDLGDLNHITLNDYQDPETQNRIDQFEMAFRMQASVPELSDISKEPEKVFETYGPESKKAGSYAANCILARRLAERGVRFIQLYHRGWDQHDNLPSGIKSQCYDTDQPTAALLMELKERGLLEDTLVIWGGEFGRTVYSQGKLGEGRDHHGRCFSSWVAGGGVKAGVSYGATDDYSYNIAENPVHIRDLNATILHCLGINHDRFTFRYQGLNQKPTGVEPAKVVRGVLA
jgi:uncharacterized protein (DUF1501 family)